MAISVDSVNNNISKSLMAVVRGSQELSSGKKKLNAAELAIASGLENEAALAKVSQRNIDYGTSVTEIQGSVYNQAGEILTRISELATSAANGTQSQENRDVAQAEITQLQQELQRQTQSAEFNGVNVFSGPVSIQVGTDGSDTSQIAISSGDISSAISSALTVSVNSAGDARAAIDQIASVASLLSTQQSSVGANASRLQFASNAASSAEVEARAAEGRIADADVAAVQADVTKNKILAQAGVAALAHNISQASTRLLA